MFIDTMTVNDEDGNEFELSKAEFEAEMVGELAFLLTDIYSDASLLELVYLNGWTAQYQMEGNWRERGYYFWRSDGARTGVYHSQSYLLRYVARKILIEFADAAYDQLPASVIQSAVYEEINALNVAIHNGAEVYLRTYLGQQRIKFVSHEFHYHVDGNGGFGRTYMGCNDGEWARILRTAKIKRALPRWEFL